MRRRRGDGGGSAEGAPALGGTGNGMAIKAPQRVADWPKHSPERLLRPSGTASNGHMSANLEDQLPPCQGRKWTDFDLVGADARRRELCGLVQSRSHLDAGADSMFSQENGIGGGLSNDERSAP